MDQFSNQAIGLTSHEIESIFNQADSNDLIDPCYFKLVAKASAYKKTAFINSVSYQIGETVNVPITNINHDNFVSFEINDNIDYRLLTEEEKKLGKIKLISQSDTYIKFYRYCIFIDDRCVIAGGTNKNRILLNDFLDDGREKTYCFGFDSFDKEGSGVICATNDFWKVFNIRYIYSGYYQVNVDIKSDKKNIDD